MGLRTDNPCYRLAPVLGPQQDLVQYMRALLRAWTLGDARSGPHVFPGTGGTPLPEKRLRRLLQSN